MGSCCCKPTRVHDDNASVEKGAASHLAVLRWPAGAEEAQAGAAGAGALSKSIEKISSKSAVKVAVVVRPLLPFELQAGAKEVVAVAAPSKISLPQRASNGGALGDTYDFTFDRVYRADGPAARAALHDEMITNVLDRFAQGFNGTILAYGQTGSGKTYTMGTAAGAKEMAAAARGGAAAVAAGVVPRAVARVFEYLGHAAKLYDTTLKVTYVEIYNEQVQDLLAPGPPGSSGGGGGGNGSMTAAAGPSSGGSSASLSSLGGGAPAAVAIRETAEGEIVLDGATEARVSSRDEVSALLARGNERRAVGGHKLNEASSRSHAVLTLALEQRARPGAALPRELRYLRSKLALVDLAGSERAKQTGTTGARFQEGVSINSGLLALGNVITALSEAQRGGGGDRGGGGKQSAAAARRHIPYRDSKLTRLLQDGLGGNSETLFIACVSPADASHEHTVGTLRYASRAMLISNSLQLNNTMTPEQEAAFLRSALEAVQAEAAALRAEVGVLKAEIATLRGGGGGGGGTGGGA